MADALPQLGDLDLERQADLVRCRCPSLSPTSRQETTSVRSTGPGAASSPPLSAGVRPALVASRRRAPRLKSSRGWGQLDLECSYSLEVEPGAVGGAHHGFPQRRSRRGSFFPCQPPPVGPNRSVLTLAASWPMATKELATASRSRSGRRHSSGGRRLAANRTPRAGRCRLGPDDPTPRKATRV